MTINIYEESLINDYRTRYNYRLFTNNPIVNERVGIIVNQQLKNNLKIMENYDLLVTTSSHNTYKKFNKNYSKNNNFGSGSSNNYNKRNRVNEIEYIRNIPKERPKTFLNTSKGKEDDLRKEINGNLNKLSNKNSDKIFSLIIKSFSDNIEIFDYSYFIDNLFDKAVMQPIYCPIYVKLFILLKNKCMELTNKDENENELVKLVREKCQSFKNMITDFVNVNDDVLNVNDYDDFCDKNKQKLYKKGFSQFIGELYKNDFVDCQYIIEYIDGLINNIKYNLDNDNTNIENSSICLCELILTSLSKKDFLESDSYDNIKEIINYKILPKKIKFKFLDLIEK